MGCVWIVRLCYCGFELAGATLSPTRISRCPDQSSNLQSVARKQGVLLTCPRGVYKKCLCVCVCVCFTGPWISFFLVTCVCISFGSALFCSAVSESMCWWVWLLRVVTQSLSQHPLLLPPLCVETVWDCFSMCCCSWIPASCIQYLQYLSSHGELHWKPLYHISITDALSL